MLTGSGGPLLALDTSGDGASACILLPDGRCELRVAPAGSRAGDVVHGLLRDALDATGLTPGQLSLIAAVRGPGSFTGLRVGLAAAAGLAFGASVPAAGVETTRAVAQACGAAEGEDVVACLEGGQGRFFFGHHRISAGLAEPLDGPLDLTPAEVLARLDALPAHAILRGSDAALALFHGRLRRFDAPLARAAAQLAASSGPEPLEALYARAPAIRPSGTPR